MKKNISLLIFSTIFICSFASYAKSIDTELTFSKSMSNFLKKAEKDRYYTAELAGFFDDFRSEGDKYCRYYLDLNQDDYNPSSFVGKKYRKKKWCKGCAHHGLRAGCWNFFKMNDRSPHRDFELVRAISAQSEGSFDCYSVGFMQPYIMHTVLGCANITSVDFDWRIHDAHHQVNYALKNLSGATTSEDIFGKLDIGWVAYGRMAKVKKPTSATFCGKKRASYCADYMEKYISSHEGVSRLELMVSPLHEMEVDSSKNTKVFYFSNATEKIYISKRNFEKMIGNIHSALEDSETAYLIHHVGGYGSFGLYSLTNRNGKSILETVCKDNYYKTYFEDLATPKKKIPTCQNLQKKKKPK